MSSGLDPDHIGRLHLSPLPVTDPLMSFLWLLPPFPGAAFFGDEWAAVGGLKLESSILLMDPTLGFQLIQECCCAYLTCTEYLIPYVPFLWQNTRFLALASIFMRQCIYLKIIILWEPDLYSGICGNGGPYSR